MDTLFDNLIHIMRCPRTGLPLVVDGDVLKTCSSNVEVSYPIVRGIPVLVDFERSILNEADTLASAADSVIERPSYRGAAAGIKRLLSPLKRMTRTNVAKFIALVEALSDRPKILVIGGGSIGNGMRPIYDHPAFDLFSFDIYASPNIQFIADAHHMPLASEAFDAVIIQAVLEHVLQPAEVAAEIWRVLKPQGIVYAETPFMQQVHEGPYDFTRFTESGHRYLFRGFERIASGSNGGPGIQFMWSADYLFRGLFRSQTAGKIAKLMFFWTQYLDLLIPESYAGDGASGVYFLGRKSETTLNPTAIVTHYQGAQRKAGSLAGCAC